MSMRGGTLGLGRLAGLACLMMVLMAGMVRGEDQVNPAMRGGSDGEKEGNDHLPSWEMPAVQVQGHSSKLREEDRIGENLQPRWTARRRFGETRVYVRPAGDFEFEYWLVPETPRHNGRHEVKTQYEVEMGLPYRFQIDIYLVSHQDGNRGAYGIDESKFEVRWALANWGVIPTNPTLYLEWAAVNNEPDHIEAKLLLGDELMQAVHWGVNFVVEGVTGDTHETTYEVTGGLSYTVIDEVFSAGVEAKFAWSHDNTNREKFTAETLVGPSIQVRPLKNMHINLTGLLGTTANSPETKAVVVIGWEFS